MIHLEISQLKDLAVAFGFLIGAAVFFMEQLLDLLFLIFRLPFTWIKSRK